MSFFKDSKFEELDWISQAVEPINSSLNDVLKLLPDQLEIDFSLLFSIMRSNGWWERGFDLRAAVKYLIDISKYPNLDQNQNLEYIVNCFKFEITGQPVVDATLRKITGGSIMLIKTCNTLDEKVLKNMLGQNGLHKLWQIENDNPLALSRANEILELLGSCEKGLRSRSIRSKRVAIRSRLEVIFSTNEWIIKDTDLADKVGHWIFEYIEKNNLSSFANFCKLKVMTHKGQPIYSMEEIV